MIPKAGAFNDYVIFPLKFPFMPIGISIFINLSLMSSWWTLVAHGTRLEEEGVKVKEVSESGESIHQMTHQVAVTEP